MPIEGLVIYIKNEEKVLKVFNQFDAVWRGGGEGGAEGSCSKDT